MGEASSGSEKRRRGVDYNKQGEKKKGKDKRGYWNGRNTL